MIFKGKNKVIMYDASEEIPKVVFEDLSLHYMLGQWLEVLPCSIATNFIVKKSYKYVDHKTLMKSGKVEKRELDHVCKVLGHLLKKIGIESTEECVFTNFDEERFSFDCNLTESSKKLSMSIRWADPFEFGAELNVETDEYRRTYDYSRDYETNELSFKLRYYTLKNKENSNTCFRYLSDNSAIFEFENDLVKLSITVYEPHWHNVTEKTIKAFRLKDENVFEKYLLDLSDNITIEDVYKKLYDVCLDPNVIYPNIDIKIEKKDKENEVTDLISLKDGELINFMITRGQRTISFNKFGEWSYDSEKISSDYSTRLSIKFNLLSQSDPECCTVLSNNQEFNEISEEIKNISNEVDKVKVLAKSIFESKK